MKYTNPNTSAKYSLYFFSIFSKPLGKLFFLSFFSYNCLWPAQHHAIDWCFH